MTTAGILLRNETLKTFKRLAFLVTLGFFALMATVGYGQMFLRARNDPERTFAFPGAWNEILSDPVQISMFFAATAMILLIGSEYTWKTARQNVIDGLSKNQWFAGKLLLLPLVAAIIFGTTILIGGGFALAGTPAGAQFITPGQARTLGASSLAVIGFCSMALFFVFLARSSGPGLGMFFLWIALVEQLVSGMLRQFRPSLGWLGEWFPGQHFLGLPNGYHWDAAANAAMVERMAERGMTAPTPSDPTTLVLVSLAYIAFFLLAAWGVYRARDL